MGERCSSGFGGSPAAYLKLHSASPIKELPDEQPDQATAAIRADAGGLEAEVVPCLPLPGDGPKALIAFGLKPCDIEGDGP
jgi:hypothetical protein